MLRKNLVPRNPDLEPIEKPGQVTGFASPADDYAEDRLHIIQRLVKDATNTYYFEMESNDMSKYGISKGALLVVDRSVKPKENHVVIANVEGEWVTKQLVCINSVQFLVSDADQTIPVNEQGILIFGVVTWSCNPLNGELIRRLY